MAEGDLGGLGQASRQFHGGQGAGEGWKDLDTARGMEVADQVFVGTNIDRTFTAQAGVDHAEAGGGHVAPGNAAHEQRGQEGGDVLNYAAADGCELRGTPEAGILEGYK